MSPCLFSSTVRLNVSTVCRIRWVQAVEETASVELKSGRVGKPLPHTFRIPRASPPQLHSCRNRRKAGTPNLPAATSAASAWTDTSPLVEKPLSSPFAAARPRCRCRFRCRCRCLDARTQGHHKCATASAHMSTATGSRRCGFYVLEAFDEQMGM